MASKVTSKSNASLEHIKILCAHFKKMAMHGVVKPCLPETIALRDPNIKRAVQDLNEAQIRQSFVLPLVSALGWDTGDPWEVFPEERSSGGFIDIRLRLPNGESLIWEIKRASVDLDLGTESGKEAAYQGIGYSRTFNSAPYCIVTNFERTLIFHSYNLPSKNQTVSNLVASFTWFDLLDGQATEILNHLTKDFVKTGRSKKFFDDCVKNRTVIRKRKPLEKRILDDLEKWRLNLFDLLYKTANHDDLELIDLSVQVFINRILFIRCCEDRGLEGTSQIKELIEAQNIWRRIVQNTFVYYRASYNSDLFQKHDIIDDLNLDIPDISLKEILVQTFSGTGDDTHEVYDFSIVPLEILGAAYESYLAKRVTKKGSSFKLETKPEIKKSGGVCYTPPFIVTEIVNRVIGEAPSGKNSGYKPKVLDPACGSGTFLISALRHLINLNRPVPLKKSEQRKFLSLKQKRTLLESCIFGVDLDPKAVEISKLSLLLLLLEGESEGLLLKTGLLPSLDKNIRRGNSLISPEEAAKYIPKVDLNRIHPLDWKSFKESSGAKDGFNFVIGNPPYVRIQVLQEFFPNETAVYVSAYETAKWGNVDLYVPFLERAYSLVKPCGKVGFILPTRFWGNEYGENLRKLISEKGAIDTVLNFRATQVFDGVTTYTCILILENKRRKVFNYMEPISEEEAARQFVEYANADPSRYVCKLEMEITKENPWLFAPSDVRKQIFSLERSPKKLGDFIQADSGIFQGLITGKDPVYLLEYKDGTYRSNELGGSEIEIENTFTHPILKGSADIKSLQRPDPSLRILYPYSLDDRGNAKLVDMAELLRVAPKTANYFQSVETALRGRSALGTTASRNRDLEESPEKYLDSDDPSKKRWFYDKDDFYRYSRTQALNCVLKPKLIVPSMFKNPAFLFDHNGEYALTGSGSGGGGAYAMYLKPDAIQYGQVIVGLLSSSLLKEWFMRRGDLFSGYYIGVDEKVLVNAPLPDLENKKFKEGFELIAHIVSNLTSIGGVQESTRREALGTLDRVTREIYGA